MWLPDSLRISLGKNNVVISGAMMFGYWVLDMNTIDLSLDCLPQGLVRSPRNRSSNDCPYFSSDLFGIVLIFYLVVVSRLLFRSVVALIVFFKKLLEFSPLD